MEDQAPHLPAPQVDALLRLETWHEDLLARLEELDRQVEKVLRECQTNWQPMDSGGK